MQFHMLSFEGPDAYAQAGGIATRVSGLAQALADAGLETHLWFVGDPNLPGHETRHALQLHRWCQWISRYHAAGVYDGEEGKRTDYAASLPPYLCQAVLLPYLVGGGKATILAEEWHTVDAVLHLDWLLRQAGVRQQVTIFWNANHTFSFDRINWGRLAQAAVITTVSRYMKHLMWGLGVNPLVIPNGLSAEVFVPPAPAAEIKTEIARLDDLIEDYLSLAQLATLWREVADLGPFVRACCRELEGQLASCGITLALFGLNRLGQVAFHASALRRALRNLMRNALEAMPQGGTLTLRGRRSATHVHLEIRDTGIGIPANELPLVFEPLHTTKPGGTGLGLYLAREIVAAHEGQIEVRSAPRLGGDLYPDLAACQRGASPTRDDIPWVSHQDTKCREPHKGSRKAAVSKTNNQRPRKQHDACGELTPYRFDGVLIPPSRRRQPQQTIAPSKGPEQPG